MDGIKRKSSIKLVWAIFILYSVSTFTKINYSASIAYIVKEGIFSKTHSGIIVAAFYLVYGVCQLAGAGITDRFSPYSVELASLIGSMFCNAALIFSNNYIWVLVFWSLNGFMLYPAWSGAVKMVSECVLDEHRKFGTTLLTMSIAFAGILSYACVSLVLESFGWAGMFILNTLVTAIMAIFWGYIMIDTQKVLYVKKELVKTEKTAVPENFIHLILRSGIAFVLAICFVRAVLDNGLKTWIPTMMMESYEISTVWAGIQTAAIYICNMLGVFLVVPAVQKLRNEVSMMSVLYLISIPFLIALVYVGKIPQLAAIISLVIMTTLIYSVNNIQVMFSSKFATMGMGHSGAIASLLNGFASFGVLIAGAMFGYIAENYNWQMVVIFCIALTILAVLLSIPAIFQWRKFLKE